MMRYVGWPALWTLVFTGLVGFVFPELVGLMSDAVRDWLVDNRRRWLPPITAVAFVFYVALAATGRPYQ